MHLGIITGNPGVFQGYTYPYPRKPIPAFKGRGFGGLGSGFCKNPGVLQPVVGIPLKPTNKPRNSSAGVN